MCGDAVYSEPCYIRRFLVFISLKDRSPLELHYLEPYKYTFHSNHRVRCRGGDMDVLPEASGSTLGRNILTETFRGFA